MVTGIDLVEWQIRIARGEPLTLEAAGLLAPRGHAIECRVYAEDPEAGFIPSPGRIRSVRVPGGPGIRDDSGVEGGSDVPVFYDPLVSKLVAWAEDRPRALARLRRALREYEVVGVTTSLPFIRWVLDEPAFVTGRFHVSFLDELLQEGKEPPFSAPDPSLEEVAAIAAALDHALEEPQVREGDARAGWAPMGLPWGRPTRGWKRAARLEGLRG
jgi:acetyl-CoA carboxylase biotin carboxylase subunit